MNPVLADLLKLLELERIEDNLFRGGSRDIGSPQVYGGQVLGQALMAASATVEPDRPIHSLHAYFLRRGDFNAPIVYEVDRSRDGKSFTSRRVVAIQHGEQIFHMSASFQAVQEGLDHQVPMPEVPPPEALPDLMESARSRLDRMSERHRQFWLTPRPFEFRGADLRDSSEPRPAVRHLWFRLVERCPVDQWDMQSSLLAYISDHQLLETATLPHGVKFDRGEVSLATIDHAMWFHRPFRIDEWLLYAIVSPTGSGSRGMAFGRIFDRAGRLVASTAQEGLVRDLRR